MSFVYLQIKAARIKKLRDAYEQEKKWAMEKDLGEEPELTCYQKYQQFWKRVRRKARDRWSKFWTLSPDGFLIKLTTFGTFENFILKSVCGFLGGVALTYLLFMFFVFALNINLKMATIICILIGPILAIGLAFSMRVRCIVFLLLPVFISKHGRQALMACVFILVMTGPAKNALHNVGVLSESLVCGQESLKKAATELAEMVKQPFIAVKAAIKDIMKTVKKVVTKLKDALMAIKRAVMAILGVFKAAGEWLGSIFNICSKKVGTPFERCEKAFDGAIYDCLAKLGPMFNWLCSIAYITKIVCYAVKMFDFICMAIEIVGAIAENAVAGIKRKLNEFVSHLRGIFYVKVDFDHSFHFETNASRGAEEITTGMVTEIQHRIHKILVVFDLMSWTFSLFFLFILVKVLHYRHKYMVSDRFDNFYITRRFRDLDMKRAQHDQETLLPLNHREKKVYIPISSPWLVYSERVKLTKSVVFLGASSFKMLIHMAIDYSLYWVLSQIRFHGRFQSEVEAPPSIQVKVEGEGAVSDIYRSTVKAFTPMSGGSQLDSVPCLPDPMPPNLSRYTQIGVLILFTWLTAFVEPYGLRLRQVVMSYYHPDRAAQRAVWLYNNVLRSRGSFLKFARRQLRRSAIGASDVDRVTFMERLRASFPLLDRLLGSSGQEACLLCGHVYREGDEDPLVHCSRPGCIGKYCIACYADLLNICTICMEPVEYGDLSDQDEEKDSSDEERPARQRLSRPSVTQDDDDRDVEAGLLEETESDVSSDLSYSYQYRKFSDRPPSRDPSPTPPWRDVERQYQDEPASLQDFHRDSADADADAVAEVERAPGADARMTERLKQSSSVKIERETKRMGVLGRKRATPQEVADLQGTSGERAQQSRRSDGSVWSNELIDDEVQEQDLSGHQDYHEVLAKELSRFLKMDSPAIGTRRRGDLNARARRKRVRRKKDSVRDYHENDNENDSEDDGEGDSGDTNEEGEEDSRPVDDGDEDVDSTDVDIVYVREPLPEKQRRKFEGRSKNGSTGNEDAERKRSRRQRGLNDEDKDVCEGAYEEAEDVGDDYDEEVDSSEDEIVIENRSGAKKSKATLTGNRSINGGNESKDTERNSFRSKSSGLEQEGEGDKEVGREVDVDDEDVVSNGDDEREPMARKRRDVLDGKRYSNKTNSKEVVRRKRDRSEFQDENFVDDEKRSDSIEDNTFLAKQPDQEKRKVLKARKRLGNVGNSKESGTQKISLRQTRVLEDELEDDGKNANDDDELNDRNVNQSNEKGIVFEKERRANLHRNRSKKNRNIDNDNEQEDRVSDVKEIDEVEGDSDESKSIALGRDRNDKERDEESENSSENDSEELAGIEGDVEDDDEDDEESDCDETDWLIRKDKPPRVKEYGHNTVIAKRLSSFLKLSPATSKHKSQNTSKK